MLTPKRVKHRKWRQRSPKGIEVRSTTMVFGTFGLKSMGERWITARQIEAARRAIIRYFKKGSNCKVSYQD